MLLLLRCKKMRTIWIQLTMGYFLITGLWGILMRAVPLMGWSINYDHLLHAHSHLALLGWSYSGLFLMLVWLLYRETSLPRTITALFWSTQVCIVAMFIAFNMQGYALFSIAFSTIHILLSYVLIGVLWKKLRPGSVHHLYYKGALVFMGLSSIGPWSLAIIAANNLKDSPLYDMAIYFYLHFQYNGWFTLGLLGTIFALLGRWGIAYNATKARLAFHLYAWSLAPAFMLSILWYGFDLAGEAIAFVSGLAQFSAILITLSLLYGVRAKLAAEWTGWARVFTLVACISLALKAFLELGSALPTLTDLIYETRSVIIGYLHLTLLGFVSFLILGLFMRLGWIASRGTATTIGAVLLLGGFLLNEATLFLQALLDWAEWAGGALPWGMELLLLASVLMTSGIALLILQPRGRLQRGDIH
jgi:hypothetical protein